MNLAPSHIHHHSGGGISIVGPDAVNVFALIALKGAIKMYAKHKIKANRMYTPTNMLAAAEKATGKKYKRGAWDQMMQDLDKVIATARSQVPETSDAEMAEA